MISHHIAPVENKILFGLCIDADNTKVHEDLIRITHGKGGETQIDIAVVVPPIKSVVREDLYTSLKDLVTNFGKEILSFIPLEKRRLSGFNHNEPRSAIVATYIIDKEGDLIFEELMLSQAIGTMISFSDYKHSKERVETLSELKKVLKTKPHVQSHVRLELHKNFPESSDPGYQTTMILTRLFNDTCRIAAREKHVKITFIRRPEIQKGEDFFRMNDGLAKFNSCLRDPCSFINTANLFSYLCGEKIPPFTKKHLRKRLPVKEIRRYRHGK